MVEHNLSLGQNKLLGRTPRSRTKDRNALNESAKLLLTLMEREDFKVEEDEAILLGNT